MKKGRIEPRKECIKERREEGMKGGRNVHQVPHGAGFGGGKPEVFQQPPRQNAHVNLGTDSLCVAVGVLEPALSTSERYIGWNVERNLQRMECRTIFTTNGM